MVVADTRADTFHTAERVSAWAQGSRDAHQDEAHRTRQEAGTQSNKCNKRVSEGTRTSTANENDRGVRRGCQARRRGRETRARTGDDGDDAQKQTAERSNTRRRALVDARRRAPASPHSTRALPETDCAPRSARDHAPQHYRACMWATSFATRSVVFIALCAPFPPPPPPPRCAPTSLQAYILKIWKLRVQLSAEKNRLSSAGAPEYMLSRRAVHGRRVVPNAHDTRTVHQGYAAGL